MLYEIPAEKNTINLVQCSLCNKETEDDATRLICNHSLCHACAQSNGIGAMSNSDDCPCCARQLKKKLSAVWKAMETQIENLQISSKFQQILQLLQQHSSENVVIFDKFVTSLQLLRLFFRTTTGKTALHGREILFLVGKQHCKQQEVLQQVYQASKKYILLCSITVGNIGLNFTTATVAVIVTPMWNPQQETQAVMRIYRMGQQHKTTSYKLFCNTKSDKNVSLIQNQKLSASADLMTGHTIDSFSWAQMQSMWE
jgi:SNF2 family DNA or RNA helicase